MSIFVLKSQGIEPMLIGDLGIKNSESIYIEVEEINIPKKYRINKLGGMAVVNGDYMRSNTSGITCRKYFKKVAEPLDFEATEKEKFEILNDKNRKFDLSKVIEMLEETDKNYLYSIYFDDRGNGKFYLKVIRRLDEEKIKVEEHEFKEYEKNFRGMYDFSIRIAFDSVNLEEAIEIEKDYYKNGIKLNLETLKSIINKYNLKIANEDDHYMRTHYEKSRTNFNGRHSEGIKVYDNNINEIMTFAEATEKWGLADSTLRKLVKTDKIKENVDYRKSGKVWLITKSAMEKIYGEIKRK